MNQGIRSEPRRQRSEVRFIEDMIRTSVCLILILLVGCEPTDEKQTRVRLENVRRANDTMNSMLLYHHHYGGRFPERLEDLVVTAEGANDKDLIEKSLSWIDPDDLRESPWTYRVKDRPVNRGGPVAIIEAKRPDGTVIIARAVDQKGSVSIETLDE